MNTIWKYKLEVVDRQLLQIPVGFEILTVQVQNDEIALWVMVDRNAPPDSVLIEILGTGNPIPPTPSSLPYRNYTGTVQTNGDALVWHVFHLTSSREQ